MAPWLLTFICNERSVQMCRLTLDLINEKAGEKSALMDGGQNEFKRCIYRIERRPGPKH